MQSNTGDSSAGARKNSNIDLLDKLNGMWMNAKLFELGIQLFDGNSYITLIYTKQ